MTKTIKQPETHSSDRADCSPAFFDRDGVTIYNGDCRTVLASLPSESVHCCVTSPPYWGLRDYGHDGQIGLEGTPDEYVAELVSVFREVRRVLREDGTLWLNLGDSYAGSWGNYGGQNRGNGSQREIINGSSVPNPAYDGLESFCPPTANVKGLKSKDLVGIPWRVAFALRDDGWFLRQDIIWAKPNPMPESVTDRCTKSHEYVFLLSRSSTYHCDMQAIKEPDGGRAAGNVDGFKSRQGLADFHAKSGGEGSDGWEPGTGRNKRSVWTVAAASFKGAHFATFPPALIEPCIAAGCPDGGIVLDPFLGSGTTAEVARRHGCRCVGIELNAEYAALAAKRFRQRSLLSAS